MTLKELMRFERGQELVNRMSRLDDVLGELSKKDTRIDGIIIKTDNPQFGKRLTLSCCDDESVRKAMEMAVMQLKKNLEDEFAKL